MNTLHFHLLVRLFIYYYSILQSLLSVSKQTCDRELCWKGWVCPLYLHGRDSRDMYLCRCSVIQTGGGPFWISGTKTVKGSPAYWVTTNRQQLLRSAQGSNKSLIFGIHVRLEEWQHQICMLYLSPVWKLTVCETGVQSQHTVSTTQTR